MFGNPWLASVWERKTCLGLGWRIFCAGPFPGSSGGRAAGCHGRPSLKSECSLWAAMRQKSCLTRSLYVLHFLAYSQQSALLPDLT